MTTQQLDFAEIKGRASFASILDRYGIEYPQSEGQVLIRCPFHDDTNPSCSVNFEKKLFNCFSCQEGGDILDFVAKMDHVSIPEAARIIAMHSGMPVNGKPPSKEQWNKRIRDGGNEPLKFRLTLNPRHPYLFERGLTPEVIDHFGLGYCDKGVLKGRIAIPIHDAAGQLVAYAGRWASDDIPKGVSKYLLPRGFQKRNVLFNFHRVVGVKLLLIVEGYWSVFRLHALGPIPAVALMGRTLSEEQEDLLGHSGTQFLSLVLDGDEPGREATEQLLHRLSMRFFLKTTWLPDDEAPDTVDERLLLDAVRLP